MPSTATDWQTRVGTLAVLVVLLVCALPGLIMAIGGEAPAFRDAVTYFLPMKVYLGDQLRQGDLPLWEPFTESGRPFLANPQAQVLYPPNLLAVLLPPALGQGLFIAVHLAWAGLGMLLWVRCYRLRWTGAVVGALAYGLGGPLIASTEFSSILVVGAWIPWACLGAARVAGHGRRRDWMLWVGSVAALGLGGAPHLALSGAAMALAVGLLAPARAGTGGATVSPARRLGRLVLGGALAAGLTAAQLLPFLELASLSDRPAELGLEMASAASAGAGDLAGLLAPEPDAYALGSKAGRGQPYMRLQYQGVLTLLLALAGIVTPWWRRPRGADRSGPVPDPGVRVALTGAVVAVVGWTLAAGDATPVFPLAHASGALAGMRYPSKLLVPASAGVALLAALGAARLAGRRRAPAVAAAVLAVGLGAGSLVGGEAGFLHAAAFALVGALVLAIGRTRWLPLLLALDLLVAHLGAVPTLPPDRVLADFPEVAAVRASGERAYVRPFTRGDLAREAAVDASGDRLAAARQRVVRIKGYVPLALRLRSVRGSQVLRLDDHARWLALADRGPAGIGALRSGAVSSFLSMEPLPGGELRRRDPAPGPPELYRVPGALPRAYLAGAWRRVDADEAVEAGLDPDVQRGDVVALESDPGPAIVAVPETARVGPGSLEVIEESPDRRRFRVSLQGPALLVVVESYYPGWMAEVGGEPAPVLRANGHWMAIPLPAGRSDVRLEFRPGSLRSGLLVSLLSAVALLVLLRRVGPIARQEDPISLD